MSTDYVRGCGDRVCQKEHGASTGGIRSSINRGCSRAPTYTRYVAIVVVSSVGQCSSSGRWKDQFFSAGGNAFVGDLR